MNKKTLALRYGVLFCFVGLVIFILLNSYKQQQIESQLQKETQKIKLAYKDVLEEHYKLSKLIFFNDLLYDTNIVQSYQNYFKNNATDSTKLYAYLKQKFVFYKSFGVKNINFYLPNNELLLTMDKTKYPAKSQISEKKSLIFVNSTFKEMYTIEVFDNKASLVVTKPLFDNNLKHLGAIEFELSLDYIANMVEKKTEYDVFFLYDQRVQKKIENQAFSSSILNSKYRIENSIHKTLRYKEEIMQSIVGQKHEHIVKNMSSLQEFASFFNFEGKSQDIVFIPLFHLLSNEHHLYLVAYSLNSESEIAKIMQNHHWLLLASLLTTLVGMMVLYKFHLNRITENALQKKYTDLLDAIDKYVVMLETDKSGFITYITEAFCNISGYTKKELIGRNINVLRHPDMSKKFFENMWHELRTNKRWEGEIKNQDKNGNSYWVKGIIFPKLDTNDNLIGYVSIRVNVTDAKQLKKINNLLKEDLSNKLNEIKMRDETLLTKSKIMLMGKILDSVSHQWKTPMGNISIELTNLKARIENKSLNLMELKKIQEEISYQLKTLSMTLNDFKTFFNQNSDNDKFNVYSAVNESIALIKDECKLHNIKVELHASKEIYSYGIFNELRQIITNLLQNSVYQLIVNEISEGKIVLRIVEEAKEVIIKFEDNAKGSSKHIIDDVFSENYNEKLNKDAGINLFIVKLLIQKIGAQLLFENREDKTVFYIKLIKLDRRKDTRV